MVNEGVGDGGGAFCWDSEYFRARSMIGSVGDPALLVDWEL